MRTLCFAVDLRERNKWFVKVVHGIVYTQWLAREVHVYTETTLKMETDKIS